MKIGILTYHCVPNFGAQLQAISTVGFLKRRGHTPIVLHWYPHILEDSYKNRIPNVQLECHKNFTDEVLPTTEIIRSKDKLIDVVKKLGIEYILSGSDALFKYTPKSTRLHFSKRKLKFFQDNNYTTIPIVDNPFFGGFLSCFSGEIGASAFSVSSQNCPYNKMNSVERKEMAECLSNYKVITVRDEWTKSMVEDITGKKDVCLSPDPVFSFEQNRWFELPSKDDLMQKFDLPDNYVLFSFSSHFQTKSYVKSLEQEFISAGYNPIALPMPEGCFDYGLKHKISLPLTPIEWYSLIKYSAGYVGERMHPIVVSIHNSVPFFCFDEYGTTKKSFFGLKKKYIIESSKTYHIISKAGLGSQMCSYRVGKISQPEEVVAAIRGFDKSRCTTFSTSYQLYYESIMDKLI